MFNSKPTVLTVEHNFDVVSIGRSIINIRSLGLKHLNNNLSSRIMFENHIFVVKSNFFQNKKKTKRNIW